MADDVGKRGPAIRRKHGQRVKLTASDGKAAVIVLRIGNGVVVDVEQLPDGWQAERLDIAPPTDDNSKQ